MEEKKKTLQEFSLADLKSLAYDRMAFMQRLQQELQEINVEIAKRGSGEISNNIGGKLFKLKKGKK